MDKLTRYAIETENKKLKKYLGMEEEKLYSIGDLVFYGVIAVFCTAILTMLMFLPIITLI